MTRFEKSGVFVARNIPLLAGVAVRSIKKPQSDLLPAQTGAKRERDSAKP